MMLMEVEGILFYLELQDNLNEDYEIMRGRVDIW